MIAVALLACLSVAEDPPRARVVDARDGKPVEGAVIELWSEEGAKPLVVATRLATLRTGADGTCTFEYGRAEARADVARVTKPGFGSVSVSTSDLEDGVELEPAVPFAGRIVDLDGRPVAGALVRTPGMCRHAAPGAEARSGSDGIFRFDDLAADDELVVVPLEHTPVVLDLATLRRLTERDGSVDLHVARRPPIRLRVLDAAGKPMARRRVHFDVEPAFVASWTDEAGRAALPPPDRQGAKLSVFEGTEELLIDSFVPRDGELTAMPLQLQREAGERAGRLTIDVRAPADAEHVPGPVLVASDGSNVSSRDPGAAPLGPAVVFVGEDFSSWTERSARIEVTRELRTVAIDAVRAPLVRVLVPGGASIAHVLVQAGPTGCAFVSTPEAVAEHAVHEVHVPDALPIAVLVVDADGEVRAGRLEPLAPGAEIELDLRAPTSITRAGAPEPAPSEPR